ncbi:MAG: hypothetical protein O2894_02120, partial [Planctomycetota bacterium]|nr:hypothetical protein [Planctomycetota bacterium]
MTDAQPSVGRRAWLLTVVPALFAVATTFVGVGGPSGVFQADLAGLALLAVLGGFTAPLDRTAVLRLTAAVALLAPAHLLAGGALVGVGPLAALAAGVVCAAAGLAALGRAVGAPLATAGVVATAVLVVAMLGLLWADELGDRLPVEQRFRFKQAVLHVDAATACAYDVAQFDRLHDPAIYARIPLASGAVRAPHALPTGALWGVVGLVAALAVAWLGRARAARCAPR